MHHESELANMWFTGDIGPQIQAKCEEVWHVPCSSRIHHHFSMYFSLFKKQVLHVLQIHVVEHVLHIMVRRTCSTKHDLQPYYVEHLLQNVFVEHWL